MPTDRYSPRERLAMILAGEQPDRYAVSMWRHFFHLESTIDGTVDAMVHFQNEFNWDFMKINPRADFHIEDWGFRQTFSTDEFTKHRKDHYPIQTPDDWRTIRPLDPTDGILGDHLRVIEKIRKRVGPDLPLFMTLFTPLAVAGRLIERNEDLIAHLRSHPEIVQPALEAITTTFTRYASEIRNAGADGLFYATTHFASSDMMTWDEYRTWGIPYDRPVIEATESDATNILHVCDTNAFVTQLAEEKYPAQILSWNAYSPTNLPLDKAYTNITDYVIASGVDDLAWLQLSEPDEVSYLVSELTERYAPERLIVAPTCAIPPETPADNLRAVRRAVYV